MRNNGFRSFPRALGRSALALLAGLLLGALAWIAIAFVKLRADHPEMNLLWAAEITLREGLLPLLTGGAGEGLLSLLGRAAPTALLALGASLAAQGGMLQLGGAGHYALGAAAAMACASGAGLPWYACLIAAALAGALWGAVPGLLKARLRLPEGLGTALSAWLALYALSALFPPLAWQPAALEELSLIAALTAGALTLIVWLGLRFTVPGLELRLLGASESAARYAGMVPGKTALLALCLSGLLGGLAGGLDDLLGNVGAVPDLSLALTGAGLHGLAAAALAGGHPLGSACMALLIQYLSLGAARVNGALFPPEAGEMTLALALYFGAAIALGRKGGRKA